MPSPLHSLPHPLPPPQVKPGDRVSILGLYKAVAGSRVAKFHGGVFKVGVVEGGCAWRKERAPWWAAAGNGASLPQRAVGTGVGHPPSSTGYALSRSHHQASPPFGPFTLTSCHPAPSNPIPSLLQAVIVGISVQKLTRENTVKHTMAEVQQIRSLAGRDDVLQLLANSLAPSIYGHDIIKRGLVLQVSEELKRSSDMVTHTSVMCDALH